MPPEHNQASLSYAEYVIIIVVVGVIVLGVLVLLGPTLARLIASIPHYFFLP